VQLAGHSRQHQATSIVHVFFEEEVQTASADEGGRQAPEVVIGRTRWGSQLGDRLGGEVTEIRSPSKRILLRSPQKFSKEGRHFPRARPVINHGVYEVLETKWVRQCFLGTLQLQVACHQRDSCCQAAASALTKDSNTCGVNLKLIST